MTQPKSHQLVYEYQAGWLGILLLCACCAVTGIPLVLLLTGQIEGTTQHPVAGAVCMTVFGVAMGVVLGGWHSRTVVDRDEKSVTHHWSVFGVGTTQTLPLSDFDRVTVRRLLRINGRVRKRVLLVGRRRELTLASFYTLKGAKQDGARTAAFCQFPLAYDDRVPAWWPV